jgi:hypothetical protein
MDDHVAWVADNCFRLSLDDTSWLWLGFKRRPRRNLLARLTKPAWKRELETRIVREFALIFGAAHAVALKSRDKDLLQRLTNFYWGDGNDYMSKMFESKEACSIAMREYVAAFPEGSAIIFASRIQVQSVPSRRLRETLILGCKQLQTCLSTIVTLIEHGVDPVSRNHQSDIEFVSHHINQLKNLFNDDPATRPR